MLFTEPFRYLASLTGLAVLFTIIFLGIHFLEAISKGVI